MPIGDVARALGVTTERVRQLDAELQPKRVGRYRRYDPVIVQRVLRLRQHSAVEADDDAAKIAALPPDVRAELDARCAALFESRRELAAAALAEDAAVANLRTALANQLDTEMRELFDERAHVRSRVLRIGRAREDEGVVYLNDPELDDAQVKLEAIDRRIGQRVQALLARLKSIKGAKRRTPKAPTVGPTKSVRAPADRAPPKAHPSKRGKS
jgi:DNA-binding transcriptional MerR regulator